MRAVISFNNSMNNTPYNSEDLQIALDADQYNKVKGVVPDSYLKREDITIEDAEYITFEKE